MNIDDLEAESATLDIMSRQIDIISQGIEQRRADKHEEFMRSLEDMPPLQARPGGCQEASPASRRWYIPCNALAVENVGWKNSDGTFREGPYRMCEPCAHHNVENRGAVYVCVEAG